MPPSQKEDSDRMVAIKYGTRSPQNIGTSHLISPPFAIKNKVRFPMLDLLFAHCLASACFAVKFIFYLKILNLFFIYI